MITIESLRIGQLISFIAFDEIVAGDKMLKGEIVELYQYPQPCGEETDEDYYTFNVVAEINGQYYNLSEEHIL